MKKTISLFLILGISTLFADQASDLDEQRMAWAKAYLEKQGLPVPDGGIKIMPETDMSSYAKNKEQRLRIKASVKKYGYIKEYSPSTNQLLTLKLTSKRDLVAHEYDYDPKSTHLKQNLNELKMAYTPTQVPSSVADTYIGAAPYLSYLQGKGWVGAIQFFTNKEIGNCSFSENNVKLSHGSIIIAKEDVRNDVNSKTTTVEIMGTPDSGFTYTVEWFDDAFFRKLECAHKEFSADLTNTAIKIAQVIDQ